MVEKVREILKTSAFKYIVAKSLGGAAEGMYRGCNFHLNMPLPVRGIVYLRETGLVHRI